jgi:uncharacterized protein YjiK
MKTSWLLSVLLLSCTPGTVKEDTAASGDTDTDTDTDTSDTDTTDTGPDLDADDDGYISTAHGGDDCDDDNPDINPGAAEVYYDGVDADCDGASDYDADGDGADAAEWGGEDCDDTDGTRITDCEAPDTLLEGYADAGISGEISEIATNLSGVTFNPETGTYMVVRDSNRRLHELDTDLSHLREISLLNVDHTDLEDIVYLGSSGTDHEFAIVAEDGVMYIGVVPEGATTVDLSGFQVVTWADMPASTNSGGEGVAFDPASETFWVCVERSPMAVHRFARPADSADASYDDGLVVTEPFDAEEALGGRITDISSCRYDARVDRLLILSHESAVVLEVEQDGSIVAELSVAMSKPEGITVNDDADMLIVGEPNDYRLYTYSGP